MDRLDSIDFVFIQKITINEVEALQAISRLTFYETFADVNTKENMSRYLENVYGMGGYIIKQTTHMAR